MTQEEVLRDLLDLLEAAGIAYMIVGSTASNLWGMPRATQDADIVVELTESSLDRLVRSARPRYYVPEGIARAALATGGMFNLIHSESAFKLDLIVRPSGPRASDEFTRRRRSTWLGRPAWFAAPADVIVAKLRWHQQGGGDNQLRDCAGIIRMQGNELDLEELRQLAAASGVLGAMESLLAEATGSR